MAILSDGDDLTERERHIAECVAHGLDNRQIAEKLGLDRRAVSNSLCGVYKKLGYRNDGRTHPRVLLATWWSRRLRKAYDESIQR